MTLKTYIVTWEIELDAESPRAAAEEALETLRDPLYSTAIVFTVIDPKTRKVYKQTDAEQWPGS